MKKIMFPVFPSNPYSIINKIANFNPKEEERKWKIMESCPLLEYEEDMGKTIPYCKMDYKPCYVQCEKKFEVEEG